MDATILAFLAVAVLAGSALYFALQAKHLATEANRSLAQTIGDLKKVKDQSATTRDQAASNRRLIDAIRLLLPGDAIQTKARVALLEDCSTLEWIPVLDQLLGVAASVQTEVDALAKVDFMKRVCALLPEATSHSIVRAAEIVSSPEGVAVALGILKRLVVPEKRHTEQGVRRIGRGGRSSDGQRDYDEEEYEEEVLDQKRDASKAIALLDRTDEFRRAIDLKLGAANPTSSTSQ